MMKLKNRDKVNQYLNHERYIDKILRLIENTKNGLFKALKGMSKVSSTKDIKDMYIETFRKWIKYQMTPNMKWSFIGINHVKQNCLFDVSKDDDRRKPFSWNNPQSELKKFISIKQLNLISQLTDYNSLKVFNLSN